MNQPVKQTKRARSAAAAMTLEPRVDQLPATVHQAPQVQQVQQTTPMDLIAAASARGASAEELGKLLDLFDRQQAREAERAFLTAFTAFKKNPPDIIKRLGANFTTDKGTTSYSYADLAIVCDAVIESLAAHGLTHAWSYKQNGTQVSVTCTLTHELGHHREATLSANDDRTGSKNAIQATGSAVHYLERYTLLGVSGLATRDGTDDDGAGASEPPTDRRTAGRPAEVAANKNAAGKQPGPSEQLLKNARAAADGGHVTFDPFWKHDLTAAQRGLLRNELADLEARVKKAGK